MTPADELVTYTSIKVESAKIIMEETMTQTRRNAILGMAAAYAVATLSPWPALAQAEYPSRPVRVAVPYAAGGGTDLTLALLKNSGLRLWISYAGMMTSVKASEIMAF